MGTDIDNMKDRMVDILMFAQAYNLSIAKTFFGKREQPLITYKSGHISSNIDCIPARRPNMKSVKHCKVIPGESI